MNHYYLWRILLSHRIGRPFSTPTDSSQGWASRCSGGTSGGPLAVGKPQLPQPLQVRWCLLWNSPFKGCLCWSCFVEFWMSFLLEKLPDEPGCQPYCRCHLVFLDQLSAGRVELDDHALIDVRNLPEAPRKWWETFQEKKWLWLSQGSAKAFV
jgi:hypothetical protein